MFDWRGVCNKGTVLLLHYDLFDSETFPEECWSLGFEMDCGKSFLIACGEEAWHSHRELTAAVEKIDDMKLLGSALFSQWRYFNHWSYEHATEEDKEWFLIVLRRMQELVTPSSHQEQ